MSTKIIDANTFTLTHGISGKSVIIKRLRLVSILKICISRFHKHDWNYITKLRIYGTNWSSDFFQPNRQPFSA